MSTEHKQDAANSYDLQVEPMSTEDTLIPSISPKLNGPLIVKNVKTLKNRNGSVETKPNMALCRCGQSGNKPFCDGTHTKVGFSSDNTERKIEDKRNSYEGRKITIHDNRSICAHAGICTDQLSSVFRMKQEPWIDPDAASVEDIITVVNACPSGALSYSIEEVERSEQSGSTEIFISLNGPYFITGDVDLVDTTCGQGASKSKFALCRCGGSKNKPFCDGSHWHNDFKDDRN